MFAPGAVCNDGSPGGFYWRAGEGEGKNRFVIHLQGGAWCYDEDSCNYRWNDDIDLMSSTEWEPTIYMSEGLFNMNPLKNAWWSANSVYVMYCSSDVWAGNGTSNYPGATTQQWQFRGKVIIKELIEVLWNSYGLDSASSILFSGCSAGGQGVVMNLDFVAALLAEKESTAVMKGFADAGWLQNFVPYFSYEVSTSYQMQVGYPMWQGVIEPTCLLANPGWEWLCYFTPFAYPYIKTPIFIQTEQYDTYQVTSNCGNPPFNSSEMAYVQSVRHAFDSSLTNIHTNPNGFFSAACFHHCSSEDNSYNTILINGSTLSQALAKWFFQGVQVTLLDTCQGFNCSSGCPPDEY